MMFYFPNHIHLLQSIKNQKNLLGLTNNNNSYIIGIMNDKEAIYLTRMLSNKAVGKLHNFNPMYVNDYSPQDRSSLLLHDKIRLSITKDPNHPEVDWMSETVGTHEVLEYPRKKYVGIILPTEKIKETPDTVEYHSLVIEPIFDPKNFTIDI